MTFVLGKKSDYIFPRHSKIRTGIASRIHPTNMIRKGQSPTRASWTIAQIIAIKNRT
jgi:hypothetical protein